MSFFQCAPLNNWTMKWWNVIQLFNCVVYKKNRFWDLIETIILYTLMIENFFANDVVIYGTIFDLMLQSFLITRKLHLRIKWRIINSYNFGKKFTVSCASCHLWGRKSHPNVGPTLNRSRDLCTAITHYQWVVNCILFFSEKLFNTSKCNFTPVNVTLPLTHSFL